MNWITGWPALAVIALSAAVGACISESRIRFIVNWLLLPVLCEGVLLQLFYFNTH